MKIVKRFLFVLSPTLFVIFSFLFAVYITSLAQPTALPEKQEVVYQLPYPGILPDHPLYLAKLIRDHLMIFFTRDLNKKAELYLLYSDKRVAMAKELVKKNRYQLAIITFSKGEKYFFKITSLLKEAKKQGLPLTNEFKDRLQASNKKHQQEIGSLLSNSSQTLVSQIDLLYKLNEEIKKELDHL